MNRIDGMNRALDFIEAHLTEKIDSNEVARQAYSSRYHFQRVFGMTFGLTLGEYIRERRLSLAGKELLSGAKVLDTALKYGYDSPESFARAFFRYHGVNPSRAKSADLRFLSRLALPNLNQGERSMLDPTIKEVPELVLVGYKKRFSGVPYGEERMKQEENFFCTTRAKQWLLIGASPIPMRDRDYCVINNVDDDGYDFYIAYELDEWTRSALFDPSVTGVDFIDSLGLEVLTIPKAVCAVFETKRGRTPIGEYFDIRREVAEWLPQNGFYLKDAPEVNVLHWREKERYIEIRLPIEQY